MYFGTRPIIVVMAALVLCQMAADRGKATVIRDGKTGPSNPAVEAGGHPLLPERNANRLEFVFPYDQIGILRTDYCWFPPDVGWPWSVFSPFRRDRHDAAGRTFRPPPSVLRMQRLRRPGR